LARIFRKDGKGNNIVFFSMQIVLFESSNRAGFDLTIAFHDVCVCVQNDALILIEEHLPFYDRTLLPPEAYFRVLFTYIKEFKYRDFYDRIKRWRVLYPIGKRNER
jgi:hypothetical protein